MRDLGKTRFFSSSGRLPLIGRITFVLSIGLSLLLAVLSLSRNLPMVDKPFPGFLVNSRMVLMNVGLYGWTGKQAGLVFPDKILEANGKTVRTVQELEAIVRGVNIGDAVIYKIQKIEKVEWIPVRTQKFAFGDFASVHGAYILDGILFLVLGASVFVMKPDTRITWIFFVTGLLLSISDFSSCLLTSTLFSYILILANALWAAPVYHLSLLFPEEKRFIRQYPVVQCVPYVFFAFFAVLLVWTFPGKTFDYCFILLMISARLGTLVFLLSVLYSFIKNRSAIARQRAKVILLGGMIVFPVTGYVTILSVSGHLIGSKPILMNILSIPAYIFPLCVGYAIARHNLFDVDVYIKRTVGYGIMTAVVAAAYWGIQVLLKSFVIGPLLGVEAEKVFPFVFALLVVFLFNPLNRQVQDAVDRMFYRKKFDYQATVTAVSDALSSVLNLDEIVRKIVGTVHSEMFIDRSGLVLAGVQGERLPAYFLGDDPSGAPREIRSDALPANDPLVELVRKKKKLVTKYDVAEDPHFADVRETCGKRFEELGASLAVPLVYRGDVKAVLAVGHKKSGHFFTREDIDLLQTLASHGAVAIENANLAEQMKKDETVRTNLSRYLSPQIVDRIVKHDVQVNLGGDRKVVTILFSDIRNFTTITETRPPDQLVTILNEYFTEMAKIIFEHQGSLDKYIGDAIVAVFGSLVPVENSAANAVAASVAMMKRLPELNRHWEARYDFSMNIGIGVNTGEVFLGNIGSPERMEFTVIGDAVNVASRFSGLAKAGQVLLTKETRALLGPDVRIREHPPAEVKGKSGKLEVFEALYTQSSPRHVGPPPVM